MLQKLEKEGESKEANPSCGDKIFDWWGQILHQRSPSLFSRCKFRSLTAITWWIMCLLSVTVASLSDAGPIINVAELEGQTLHINLSVCLTASSHDVRCNGLEVWLWDRSQRWGFDQMFFPRRFKPERPKKGDRKGYAFIFALLSSICSLIIRLFSL